MIGGRVVGIDVSRWQPKIDWNVVKAGGVDFVIVKATQGNYTIDPMFAAHVAGAKSVGLAVGAYHWCDPLVDHAGQTDYYLNVIYSAGVDFAAADVEQYWADWTEWSKKSITRFISPSAISNCARRFMDGVRAETKKNVLLYTRATFIQAYARPMYYWMGGEALWYAYYPYSRTVVTLQSWSDIPFPSGGMWYPNGYGAELASTEKIDAIKKWKAWQISGDKFILPGTGGSKIDLNLWNGDLEDLNRFAKRVVEPPAPPPSGDLESRVALLEKEARLRGWPV